MSAPVTAIVAYDTQFYEHLPKHFPHDQTAIHWFKGEGKEAVAASTAFRNGTLQGAYFMLAARAVGPPQGVRFMMPLATTATQVRLSGFILSRLYSGSIEATVIM